MLLTHFLVQEQMSGFHIWGSLQRMEKTKIEKGNPFSVQPFWLGASVATALSIGKS